MFKDDNRWRCPKCGCFEKDDHNGSFPPECECKAVVIDIDQIIKEETEGAFGNIEFRKFFEERNA